MPAAPEPPVCGMTPSCSRSCPRSRSRDGSSPRTRTVPLSALRNPAQMSRVVVLPAPLRARTPVMRRTETAMEVVTRAREGVHDAAHVIGGSRGFRAVARTGLVARAAFYLLLAGLAVDVAATRGHGGRQANAHGALSVVAVDSWGLLAVVLTAVGFFVLGVARVAGALRDRELPSWRRTTTALQGVFYVALTW